MKSNALPENLIAAVEIIVGAIRRNKSKLLDYGGTKSEYQDVVESEMAQYANCGPAKGGTKWTKDIFKRGRK